MGKVFKQLAGGYNIVVKSRRSGLTAFYSPYAYPHIIHSRRIEEVEEAMRYFYSFIWKKRKVFYCAIQDEVHNSYAIKLVPAKGNEHRVRVVSGEEVKDLYEICLLEGRVESFIKTNISDILEEAGIQAVGKLTLWFNFDTVKERDSKKRKKKHSCTTVETSV